MSLPNEITVVLDVDQGCIDTGEAMEAGYCPVALSIRHLMPDAWSVCVETETAQFKHPIYAGCAARLPEEVSDFVKKFDNGEEVEPQTFTICFRTQI